MRLLGIPRRDPECHRVASILQSFLDGELPQTEVRVVAEHLRHCRRCGIDEDVYQQVKRSLQELAVPPDTAAIRRLRSFAHSLSSEERG